MDGGLECGKSTLWNILTAKRFFLLHAIVKQDGNVVVVKVKEVLVMSARLVKVMVVVRLRLVVVVWRLRLVMEVVVTRPRLEQQGQDKQCPWNSQDKIP